MVIVDWPITRPAKPMNCKFLLFCACFASLLSSTPAATVIKILHINPQAKVRAIWHPAAVQNFSFDGKYYGLPNDVAPEVLFYNKELCQKAGVDPTQIHYWEDLIEAVKKCKAAGITPMAVGGKDKWPLHFYTALLPNEKLGFIFFPAVKGGKGKATDLFANLNGWLKNKQ
jgi:raffinose/stachyose/melibiose transport system substrate-binding protein